MFALDQAPRAEMATYLKFDNVLSETACQNVIDLSKQVPAEKAQQGSESTKRVSEIRWLHWAPGGGIDSLYRKLAGAVQTANDRFWGFHLGGFLEPLQLTHYRQENAGHYDWHADRGDMGVQANRKISGTLLLSEGFQGGELELFDVSPQPELKRGELILFPSYHVHKVNPITQGERWSLVFWVTGPPFV